MTLSDLAKYDTKRRAVSLRQLSFLYTKRIEPILQLLGSAVCLMTPRSL